MGGGEGLRGWPSLQAFTLNTHLAFQDSDETSCRSSRFFSEKSCKVSIVRLAGISQARKTEHAWNRLLRPCPRYSWKLHI